MSVAMPVDAPHPDEDLPRLTITPTGRVKQPGLSESDRNFAVAMHLTPLAMLLFFPLVFTPLVLWLVRKDDSSFVDDHGREVVNMLITGLIVGLLCATMVFIPFAIIWVIVTFVNLIRGAVAASNSEYFRYPMVIRFVS